MPYYINERAKESKKFTINIDGDIALIISLKTIFSIEYNIKQDKQTSLIAIGNTIEQKTIDKALEFARKNIIHYKSDIEEHEKSMKDNGINPAIFSSNLLGLK